MQKISARKIVILGLMVVLIGAIGFVIWQNSVADLAPSTSNRATQSNAKDDAQSSKQPYVVYADWSLRQPVVNSRRDITVEKDESGYIVRSASLDTGCEQDPAMLVRVERYVADEPSDSNSLLQGSTPRQVFGDEDAAMVLGQYLYRVVMPQAPCVDPTTEDGKATIKTHEKAIADFIKDFQNLEKVD